MVERTENKYDSRLLINDIPISNISESFLVQRFFHKYMAKEISADNRKYYKITNAIKQMWERNEDINGIIYPTINTLKENTSICVGLNIGFRPKIVDNYYEPIQVWILEAVSKNKDKYKFCVHAYSEKIANDEKIIWSDELKAPDM